MVIQTTDAATRISIDKGKITITAPTSVKIDTPIATFTKDVHIQGNVQIDKNLNVTGLMQVYGGFNATAGGNQVCTLPQSTTIGGIAVYGHGHIQTAVAGQRTSAGMIS
jgi:phage gp45-like